MKENKLIPHIDAVILAGGENRRFNGKQKSLALLNGRTLLEHQIGVLNPLFKRIILIAKSNEDFSNYQDLEILGDVIKGKGPLSGIHAGLHYSKKNSAFIFAGDMPFLDEKIITSQVQILTETNAEAVIPKTNKGIEPLHGLYSTKITEKLKSLLNEDEIFPVREIFEHIHTHFWTVSDYKTFININTKEDLKRFEKNRFI